MGASRAHISGLRDVLEGPRSFEGIELSSVRPFQR